MGVGAQNRHQALFISSHQPRRMKLPFLSPAKIE